MILRQIVDEGATLESAIENIARDVSTADRRFIRHLVATCLRRLGQLDRIIDHLTKTKLGNTQMAIRHVLRLGVCQLLFMDVPAHAAINTSVNLVQRRVSKKLHYLKNMVNAVLRAVDRERDALKKKYANSRLNIPKELLKRWDMRYGEATVKAIIDHSLTEAPLDLSFRPDADLKSWAGKLGGKILPNGGLRLEKAGNIKDLPGFSDGVWWVQDLAAQLPAGLLGVSEGDEVLDLCAAPGGKTLQSAACGATVTAVDVSKRRLERLRENLARLSLSAKIETADTLKFKPGRKWKYILLDAPCSSTGTIRRHPEILSSNREKQLEELAALQSRMLDQSVELLESGGTLVYCVCSMEVEEGPDQIKALLQRHSTLKRKEIGRGELPGLEQTILETGDVQTLPHHYDGGMDGFFISRLVKDKGH